jgi:hypothetical protein
MESGERRSWWGVPALLGLRREEGRRESGGSGRNHLTLNATWINACMVGHEVCRRRRATHGPSADRSVRALPGLGASAYDLRIFPRRVWSIAKTPRRPYAGARRGRRVAHRACARATRMWWCRRSAPGFISFTQVQKCRTLISWIELVKSPNTKVVDEL